MTDRPATEPRNHAADDLREWIKEEFVRESDAKPILRRLDDALAWAHYDARVKAEAAQGDAPRIVADSFPSQIIDGEAKYGAHVEGAAPRAEGPTPIQRLESALKNRATTDGEVVSLMNLLGAALHEARLSRPSDERVPESVAAEVAYEMKVFLHGAKSAPPVAPGWLSQIEKWRARLSRPSDERVPESEERE